MIVVTPADVANRAAVSLVDIPPVPKLEPADETMQYLEQAPHQLFGERLNDTINLKARYIFDNFDRLGIWMSPWIIRI
jgi:hypothetical protein